MKKGLFSCIMMGFVFCVSAQTPGKQNNTADNKILLSNGWSLTPAGHSLPLGDLPLNIAVSSSRRYMAVTNNGQSTQTLQLIDAMDEKILDNIIIPRSWLGLKFSADDKYLFASGGNDNCILKYALNFHPDATHPGLSLVDSFSLGRKWPEKISPAGLEIDDKHFTVNGKYNGQTWGPMYMDGLLERSYSYLSALEGYICTKDADIRGIMLYMKGETDTLEL